MSWFRRTITVPADARSVEYVDGAFTRTLGPGRHPRPWRRVSYRWVGTREQLMPLAPQEVPTSDGLGIRVSTSVRWAVSDARAFVEVAADPTSPCRSPCATPWPRSR
jgi:regulator of protease activity HflC (stomatin/prohibitin superfamily)